MRRLFPSVLSLSILLLASPSLRADPPKTENVRGDGFRFRDLNPKPEDLSAAADVYVEAEKALKQGGDDADAAAASKDVLRDFIKNEKFPSPKVRALRDLVDKQANRDMGAVPLSPEAMRASEINRQLDKILTERFEKRAQEALQKMDDATFSADAGGLGYQAGRYRDSARLLGNALRRHPADPNLHTLMARDLFELGDFKESSRSASEAIKHDPSNASAWSVRAASEFKLGDWNRAFADARQASALNPDDHMAQTIASVSRRHLDEDALPDIKPISDTGRQVSNASAGPAPTAGLPPRSRQDSAQNAASLETQAGGPPPSYRAQSLYKESLNQMELGDYKAAAESAGHSIALSPGSPEPYAARASAYNYLGRYPESIQDATRSLQLESRNPIALNARSWALNHSGQPKAALEDARAAIQQAPRDAFAYLNKAMAEEALGMWDDVEQDYQTAAALEPEFGATVQAAAARFETATGRHFRGLAAQRPQGGAGGSKRWGLSAAALIGGLGGGFLLAFLFATSLKEKAAPAAADVAGAPGGIIGGCYQIVRELGRGGMGVVFEADDLALGRKVALKRMKDTLKSNPADKEHFMDEARTVAALRHPNIVAIHSIFEEAGDLYLVFEYVPGMTLDEHLYRRKKLSPTEARDIFKPVCDALTYAHGRKVIHRDLKPANIMMTEDGQVKVMDFGLARQAKDTLSALSRTDAAGTPAYMAPEMQRGVVRRESDIYMLGGVLAEMLTGELPSKQETGDLPPGIAAVIATAMSKDAASRYGSPQEFLDAYDSALKARA